MPPVISLIFVLLCPLSNRNSRSYPWLQGARHCQKRTRKANSTFEQRACW